MFFIKIKRFLSSNKFFWKYRHLIQWSYSKPGSKKIHQFFYRTVNEYKVKSLLDYGFGKGDLLKELNGSLNISFFFGIDINKKNVNEIRKSFNKKNSFFSDELNKNDLKKTLNHFGIYKIDLIVFDRVLYILNDKELKILLEKVSELTDLILIDDFYINESITKSEYRHRDWIKIFQKYDFKCESQIESVNGSPINTCSKTFLFINNEKL